MQKYLKKDLSESPRYFEDDINIRDWIDLNEYRLMTEDEIDRHENPIKYWTQEQIVDYERSFLPPLTKRQFSLYLFDIGKYDLVMNALNTNPRFKIEFDTVSTIERSSPIVSTMGQILEWDDLVIDEKWKQAIEL
ncbi:hypothetical protein B9T31_04225 [Acinetobacter sp. ANC 4558]|uniref:hypothetical protein n=1 Tax=Acinetobacter sp. ANC 4558 TaxID=1977876 RepID=UPI000A3356FF|nr:hypothetical protein [Acinetobacter sp. ANC 4558]OTG87710.1 hypothetical protein B9T31_04225 [Acinetobacter sp. ANC 4558]